MLSRIIDVCARNRFLVFTAVLFLTLAGIWSLQHVPLDALPDISDVQVIVHTAWAGEPPDIIVFVIFLLLYLVFHSVAEALVLIFPTIYALSGGLLLQWLLKYNFSVAVAVGYIALFGIAVETGVVMVVYLHEALQHKLQRGRPLTNADVEAAAIEGAVLRLRPKLMTVCAVLASLIPILWESGIGSDVMKPNRRTYCWRDDHLNCSRPHPGSGLLCDDEGAGSQTWKAHRATPRK